MKRLDLWPNEVQTGDGFCQTGAVVEGAFDKHHLWYRMNPHICDWLSADADPFVIGMIFFAMERRANLAVHGTVSPSLLRNLEEFQDAWVLRRPGHYHKIEIIADREAEQRPRAEESAIVAFSGGVDSTFTVMRHRLNRCGRLRRKIDSALMVHGFDIPRESPDAFERAFDRARSTLDTIGLPIVSVETNHKELNPDWDFTHVLGVASALALFKKRFSLGILAGTLHYAENDLAWGSSVSTDHLLSSSDFEILHDGAAFTRLDKIKEISRYPFAYDALRLCYSAERKDDNCCKCWKCIVNILRFRALGLRLPVSFSVDVSDQQIRNVADLNEIAILSFKNILDQARQHGHDGSWVTALEECIMRNETAKPARQHAALW